MQNLQPLDFNTARQTLAGISVLIVTGPTASGKTALVDQLATQMPIAMINADMGQFYTPLHIGTAKPDWRLLPYPCYLFDVTETPNSIGVVQFRTMVMDAVAQAHQAGRLPVLVGGSLFYLHSLFWSPYAVPGYGGQGPQMHLPPDIITPEQKWQFLASIDPARAAQIHPHDTYRVDRALKIWTTMGVLPSTQLPRFESPWDNVAVWYVHPGKKLLLARIAQRVGIMLEQGWIKETEAVMALEGWQPFVQRKGFIGYSDIMDWVNAGKQKKEIRSLIESITIQTNQYARRQEKYWQRFSKGLDDQAPSHWQVLVVNPSY